MMKFRECVIRKFREWEELKTSIGDFDVIGQEPFIVNIKENSGGDKKSIKDYMIIFNKKIAIYFDKCEKLKTGFIKNKKYKNIKIILNRDDTFNIIMHKEKLLFSKLADFNEKLKLVNSLEFSLIIANDPSNHSLLGWFLLDNHFFYVYEYLEVSLDFHLSSDLPIEDLKNLLKSFISAYEFYSNKKILMDNFELFIKSGQLIFTFPKKIESFRSEKLNEQKLKLVETVERLNCYNWMNLDRKNLERMENHEILNFLKGISN
jgi:hypothetical protein